MNKFEGILIATDLDGTLLRSDKSVSQENLDAIEYFKSEGGRFTFITGRMPFFVGDTLSTVKPNAPLACINGGGLYDLREEKYIWKQPINPSVIELVEYVDSHTDDLGIQINCFDKLYFARENETMEWFRRITGVENLVRDYHEVKEPIAKIVFGDYREDRLLRVKELLDCHPRAAEFDFIRSEHSLYEILPKGISKGTLLPILANYLKVDIKRTISVGDYDNDVSMLRAAGIGIAVANATPEAKAAADLITVSNEEHAIAKIISDIESGSLSV